MRLFEVNPIEARLLLREGISHINDQKIPLDRFIEILKNIKDFEVTEKVDGANLWFGLDMEGKLYTSRGKKEGGEFYNQNDWGSDFKDTGFKSAHSALKNSASKIAEAGMNPGDMVEVEILFGEKPNAIPYWPNQIIFLRAIQGDPAVAQIADALEGMTVASEVENVPYTNDGRTIERRNESHPWTFSKVQKYNVDTDKIEQELDDHIAKLETFLLQPNIAKLTIQNQDGSTGNPTNMEVLALRATKPEIKEAKELVKDVIDGDRDPVTGKRSTKGGGIRLEIKEILLNNLVRSAQSTLGPSIEDGGWIEGVVLRRTGIDGTDELLKVVDQDIFTAVNAFNHQVRSYLTTKHKGPDAPEEASGVLGNLLRKMANVINHPPLGTIQAKRYLKKLGNTSQEIAANVAQGIDVAATKATWSADIDKTSKIVDNLLDQYNSQVDDKEFVDTAGRTHKYDETIHKRTLQVFAELARDFTAWKKAIAEADTAEQLVMVLIGDKL